VADIKIEILIHERQRCDSNSSSNGERREGESGKNGIKGKYWGMKASVKK